jgi:hypothetical protein
VQSSESAANVRVIEIARTNANAAFDHANKLLGVKSPSEFVQMATEHARALRCAF